MGRGWAFIPVLALAWLATTCAGQAIPINEPDCVTVQSPEEVLEAVQAGSRAATVCVPQGRSKCVAVLEIDTSYRERGSTWPRLYFPVQLHHASSVHRLCCVSVSLSFKDSEPLVIPATFNLTITCTGQETVVNLHSDKGEVYVPVDSWLIFDGCEVYTVDDLSLGSERVAPPALGTGYLGTSLGTALFRDSRFFFPRQFFEFYAGLGGNEKFPELTVALHDDTFFESSDVVAMRRFTSAAVAFRRGRWRIQPPGVPGMVYTFENSSVWFSGESFDQARIDVLRAEAERDSGDLIYAYGAAANPNGSFPESSWRGDLSNITIQMPTNPDGLPDPMPRAVGPEPAAGQTGRPASAAGVSADTEQDVPVDRGDGGDGGDGGDRGDGGDGGDSGERDDRTAVVIAAVLAGVVLAALIAAVVGYITYRKRLWRRAAEAARAAAKAGHADHPASSQSDAIARAAAAHESGQESGTVGASSFTAGDSCHMHVPFLSTVRCAATNSCSTEDGDGGGRTPEYQPALSHSYRSPGQVGSTDSESPTVTAMRGLSAGARSSEMGTVGSGVGAVRERVAAAVQEMQGALQAELQEDQLKLYGVIGRGGFGTVYHGQWRGLDVAIKTVIFSSGGGDAQTQLVASEAAIASYLSHKNVVATYNHDIIDVAKANGPELGVYKFYLIQIGPQQPPCS